MATKIRQLLAHGGPLVTAIRQCIPQAMAVYAFGSQIQGTAGSESDLDLAVLVGGYADPLALWDLASRLSDITGCPVDLLDLRAASTVMQYQVITTGERLWSIGLQAGLFECFVLSEKTALDTARAPLMADIHATGRIHARDVLVNKSATVERCVGRAREEFNREPSTFATDFTRQDAAILNVQRACEAVLDMGQQLVRREKLGVPQSARDVFDLLARGQWIDVQLAGALKRMVAFRNIAVHDYQSLLLPILVNVITLHLGEFLEFTRLVLSRDGAVKA